MTTIFDQQHRRGGGDDEEEATKKGAQPQTPGVEAGDYNLGDDMGTRIGEGHDPIEDPHS